MDNVNSYIANTEHMPKIIDIQLTTRQCYV